jgi:hypothetical protein
MPKSLPAGKIEADLAGREKRSRETVAAKRSWIKVGEKVGWKVMAKCSTALALPKKGRQNMAAFSIAPNLGPS